MEQIIKEIITNSDFSNIVKMMFKSGILSNDMADYLGGATKISSLAALLTAGAGSITIWTTATTTTTAAAGFWGWLGYTTTATVVTTTTAPIALVAALGAAIGYGIYKAWQSSEETESINEYSKICQSEWNKIFSNKSLFDTTAKEISKYLFDNGGNPNIQASVRSCAREKISGSIF